MNTLFARLAIMLFLLMSGLGLGLLVVVRDANRTYQRALDQALNRELAAHMVDAFPLLTANGPNPAATQALFHDLMVLNPSIEVYLLDRTGRLLSYSAPTDHVRRARVDLGPIERFLGPDPALPVLGDDPRSATGLKAFSAARILRNGRLTGYLYVILAGEAKDALATSTIPAYVRRVGVAGVLLSLAIAWIAGLLIIALLTRRLTRLSRRLAASDPLPPSVTGGNDELGRIEDQFVRMTQRIREQLQALSRADSRRRTLVAHVSLDLRTPLASLQGHLETLALKCHDLSPAQRERFLHTALRNSRQLTELVTQLFELAKLDAAEPRLRLETFPLQELVQDEVLKHRIAAADRHIRISLHSDRHLPDVDADIALVQRALDNLITNALRHTPPGGSITVRLTGEATRNRVTVSDTGCGVDSARLKHLLDPALRAGCTASDNGGLGLTIVRRILELHGTTLRLHSMAGRGTTLWFSLAHAVRLSERDATVGMKM